MSELDIIEIQEELKLVKKRLRISEQDVFRLAVEKIALQDTIKNEKEMSDDKRKEIKVDHPEFGHVIFHGATARQIEVLDSLKHTCSIANDVIAQNKMLVDMIGEMEVMLKHKDKEIEKLKSAGETPYIDFLN